MLPDGCIPPSGGATCLQTNTRQTCSLPLRSRVGSPIQPKVHIVGLCEGLKLLGEKTALEVGINIHRDYRSVQTTDRAYNGSNKLRVKANRNELVCSIKVC